MHENSKLIFQKYALDKFHPEDKVLEIGPDRQPSTFGEMVKKHLEVRRFAWTTLDINYSSGAEWIVSDENVWTEYQQHHNSFDIVMAAQVIEHVRKPWRWVQELAKFCRPDGLVIIICPITWEYHLAPIDCWRIYPDGMKALFEEAQLIPELAIFEGLAGDGVLDTIAIGKKFHV